MFPKETNILIVDDMSMMRKLVKAQLRDLGFTQIAEAQNGAEALTMIEQQDSQNTPVQLVLADWNMPILTGIELLAKLKASAKFKNLPFIIITAEGEVHQVTEAIKLGVSSFIRKPFSPESLKEKIEAVSKTVKAA